MKLLLIISIVIDGVLAPVAAHADDEPINPGTATYDEYLPGVLNCDTATWDFWTVHYAADPIAFEDGAWVYTAWYELGRTNNPGLATGTAEGDCPNWDLVEVEDGPPVWVNATAAPEESPVEPEPAGVSDAIIWKVGLVR